jgi:hypothetical protein
MPNSVGSHEKILLDELPLVDLQRNRSQDPANRPPVTALLREIDRLNR